MNPHTTLRRTGVIGIAVAVALVTGACSGGSRTEKGLVIGESTSTSTALPAPDIIEDPTTTTVEAPTTTGGHRGGGGARGSGAAVSPKLTGIPDGSPYGDAIPFSSSVEVPTNLVWVLAIGSDARPGGDMRKSNGDSIHLIGVDPQTGAGTVVGFPRDSWVKIPGRGTGKINSALAMGGPKLMAETVRQLTGLPVDFYVLTAFEGFQRIVDELGGVNVQVDKRMNDKNSGARFDPG
jgi:ABC-type antimicrobial peptide transport system permease subunit